MLVSLISLAKGLELEARNLGKSILIGELSGNVDLHGCENFNHAMIETDSLLTFYRTKRDGGVISGEEFDEFLAKFLPLVDHLRKTNPGEADR